MADMPKSEKEFEMDIGKQEETVYDEAGRENLVENDEMSAEEAGFMAGAEGDGSHGKCRNCGTALTTTYLIETKINGETMWFCTDDCLEQYKKKHGIE